MEICTTEKAKQLLHIWIYYEIRWQRKIFHPINTCKKNRLETSKWWQEFQYGSFFFNLSMFVSLSFSPIGETFMQEIANSTWLLFFSLHPNLIIPSRSTQRKYANYSNAIYQMNSWVYLSFLFLFHSTDTSNKKSEKKVSCCKQWNAFALQL